MLKKLNHFFQKITGSWFLVPGFCDTRKTRIASRGASLLETVLALALVMALAPYMYSRINEMATEITDASIAKRIVGYEARAMNYIRLNQNFWTGTAHIHMDAEEANAVMETEPDKNFTLNGMFINKYKSGDGSAFEAFMDFNIHDVDDLHVARIARMIGGDAGTVINGAAYGVYGNWSARSAAFHDGDLVYRISENLTGADTEKFLHRTVLGDEKLNGMERDLSIGGNVVYDAGGIIGDSARISNATAFFANADVASARELIFPNGANIDPSGSLFGTVRVIGDVIGFRNIAARRLTGRGGTGDWSRQGSIVADRTTVSDAVHVGKNLYIRTNSARTVSGFSGAIAHSVYTPYLSTEELYFASGYGLTVSTELISSSAGSPLKLGPWTFPSVSMPKMSVLILGRMGNASVADQTPIPKNDFVKIMGDGWKSLGTKQPAEAVEQSEE